MKKTWIYGTATLLLLGALTTACGSKDEEPQPEQQGMTSSVQTAVVKTAAGPDGAVQTVRADGKPTLNATVAQDGNTAVIQYTVTNLELSAEHMGKANVPGEGHLHLYVDGKQKAMLNTDAPVKLTHLSAGKHVVLLELQQNDHSDLNVSKELTIQVPAADGAAK